MFAFDHAGVSPDIMCLSKGLTGGYMPMSICVTTQPIYDAFYDDYGKGKAFYAQPHIRRKPSCVFCGNRSVKYTGR